MNDFLHIPVELIDVPEDRLRLVDMERVGELVQSMLDVGQITPVEVAPADANGRYRLISGAHRVKSVSIAEIATVAAVIFEGTPDECRLHEIDENLYRHELTPFDQAAFLAERRVIYERINGPITRGRPASAGNCANLAQLSFLDETAQRFNLPRRTIARALARRTQLSDAIWQRLRGSTLAKKGSDLDVLVKLSPSGQERVLALILDEGRAKSIASARRILAEESGVAPAPESKFEKFAKLWKDMSAEDRRRVRDFLKSKQSAEGG